MPTIKNRQGHALYVKEQGQGRPVVLIHGWPLQADAWDHLGLCLAEAGLRAIAYDRRGFGRSDQPADGYDYDRFADDLEDVLAHAGAEDATLIGFSMGGGEVARYLSRQGPGRIRNAVLIGSVVPLLVRTADHSEGVDPAVYEGVLQAIRNDRAAFFRKFFSSFYGTDQRPGLVSEEVLQWSWNMAMQAGLGPTLACVKAFSSTDLRPDLKAMTVPLLLVHGKADNTVPIDITSRAVARQLPHARLIEYEGHAHGLLASNKEQLAKDILAFMG
jgi:non-heme chloroperoxidase